MSRILRLNVSSVDRVCKIWTFSILICQFLLILFVFVSRSRPLPQMENVFDEIIKMLCWWFFRSHSKCKLSVKKSIIGFILKFSSKHQYEAVYSPSSKWVSQTQDSQHHELGIYLSHNFEEWNPLTQKFDSNGKYVMDKQARDTNDEVTSQ